MDGFTAAYGDTSAWAGMFYITGLGLEVVAEKNRTDPSFFEDASTRYTEGKFLRT